MPHDERALSERSDVAFAPSSGADLDDVFGPVLARCRLSAAQRLSLGLGYGAALSPPVLWAILLYEQQSAPSGTPPNWPVEMGVSLGVTIFLCVLVWLIGRAFCTRTEFREAGAVVFRRNRPVRSLMYHDCTVLQFYCGVAARVGVTHRESTIALVSPPIAIHWNGQYVTHERRCEHVSHDGSVDEADHELELVAFLAANAMAEVWLERLERNEQIEWLAHLTITAHGLEFRDATGTRRLVPYSRLVLSQPIATYVELRCVDEERPLTRIPANTPNLLVFASVLEQVGRIAQSHEDASQETGFFDASEFAADPRGS